MKYKTTRYTNLSEYLCDCIGASTGKNVCACCVDLAKYNDMTMAELFEKVWRIIYQEVIPIELENNSKQIKENLKTVLTLEYMGIHIEDTKEQDFKQLYYFSVPERSTLKVESAKEQAETADDLIKVAKETLIKMMLDSCKSVFGDAEDEEFYKDIENNISDYALFFTKVRKGEVWDKEMGKTAVNKIVEQLKNSSYKQV